MDVDELLVLYLHHDEWEEEPTKPYRDESPASEQGTTYSIIEER